MKNIFLFLLTIISLSLSSCNNDQEIGNVNSSVMSTTLQKQLSTDIFEKNLTDWESQLVKIINTPPDIMKASNIKLLAYEIVDYINNDTKLLEYIAKVIHDENMIPFYADNIKSVKAVTKNEILSLNSTDKVEYTFSKRDEYIKSMMSVDMKVLRLRWDNDGVEANTLCVVSEDMGIVYDNFISNTFEIQTFSKVVHNSALLEKDIIPVVKTRSEGTSLFTGSVTWYEGGYATWLWGSERGYAEISHTGHYSNGKFSYHDFLATHYFAFGNSDARAAAVNNSTIAFAWALATPTISINITFFMQYFTLSFGGGIGSKSGGTGQHTCPSTYYY